MPSSFDSANLFGSGPHRFSEGPLGEQTIPNSRLNPVVPGTLAIGPLEQTVIVKGRLVAATESALWTLRAAIAAKLTHPPTRATLTDNHAHSWTNMDFISFTPSDRTDHGREVSLAYEAKFVRLFT